MAFRFSFSETVPDVRDPTNETGRSKGLVLEVAERDGFVCVSLRKADAPSNERFEMCALEPEKARDVVRALHESIREAES